MTLHVRGWSNDGLKLCEGEVEFQFLEPLHILKPIRHLGTVLDACRQGPARIGGRLL